MAALNDWEVIDANNNATPPDGWPENTMQYSEVNNTGRAVQGTMKRYYADVNGSLSAAGVADAYTLTLNETGYTTYFAGMYFACSIPASNTGPSTINVNGIGVQNIVQRDGTALVGGELDAGGIYEFRYDGTNFQVAGTLGADTTIPQATLTNSNDPDLVDTDVALRVGTDDPDNNQHIEVGPLDIQSKSDATTAAQLDLNALGGDVEIGSQDGNEAGDVKLWFSNGAGSARAVVETAPGGIILEGVSGSTIFDIHTPGGNLVVREQFNGVNWQKEGFLDGLEMNFRSRRTSDSQTISMLDMDPDDAVQIIHPADATGTLDGQVLRTVPAASGGIEVNNQSTGGGFERVLTTSDAGGGLPDPIIVGSVNATSNLPVNAVGSPYVNTALNVGGTLIGTQGMMQINRQNIQTRPSSFGFNSTLFININGTGTNGSDTFIGGLNSAGIEVEFGVAVRLRHGSSSVDVVETTTPAAGGLLVNNQSTGGGLERVLTTSDLGGGGGAQISGTPANNQLAIWTNSTDIEGTNAVTYDDSPALQQFQVRNSAATRMRVAAFGIGTGDKASLYIEQEDSGDGLEITSDNQVLDEVAFYKTDGVGNRTNKVMEFNANDGVELFFLGNQVLTTALPANGGVLASDDEVTNQPILISGGARLIEGREALGGFSSEDIGIVSTVITNTNVKDFNGRCINMNNGDSLRFGNISGGGTNECGGTWVTQTSTNGITIGVSGINGDFWECSSSGIIYHNLSGTSTFAASGPGIGAWRYQGTAQVVGFLFNP